MESAGRPVYAEPYGAGAVASNLAIACVLTGCDSQLHGLAKVTLMVVADVDTLYGVVVEVLHGPVVEYQGQIAHGVDMAVEVDVAVLEGVVLHGGVLGQRRQSGGLAHGTLALRHRESILLEGRKVGHAASPYIYGRPHGAYVAYGLTVAAGKHKTAVTEAAVVALDPGCEAIVFVYGRIALHFDTDFRQYPRYAVRGQRGIAYAEGIGMFGGYFNYALHQQGERHRRLGTGLAGGQVIAMSEFGLVFHIG